MNSLENNSETGGVNVLPPPALNEESRTRNRKRVMTLAAMCLATFAAILDTTVVNLALHAIQTDLRAGLAALQWVIDAYNLVYASFILTGGALGDLFGRRRVFAAGMGLSPPGAAEVAGALIALADLRASL